MIENDNSTHSYNKMMNLFKLFGMKKARRGQRRDGHSSSGGAGAGAAGEEEEEGDITLEDASIP